MCKKIDNFFVIYVRVLSVCVCVVVVVVCVSGFR